MGEPERRRRKHRIPVLAQTGHAHRRKRRHPHRLHAGPALGRSHLPSTNAFRVAGHDHRPETGFVQQPFSTKSRYRTNSLGPAGGLSSPPRADNDWRFTRGGMSFASRTLRGGIWLAWRRGVVTVVQPVRQTFQPRRQRTFTALPNTRSASTRRF